MGLKTLAGAAFLSATLAGCGLFDELRYPEEPPIPKFARQVAEDSGFDNDSPMRSRLRVVDIGGYTASDLAAFFRSRFTAAAGWQQQPVAGEQHLCLVRKGETVDLIEIFDYRGTRVPATRDRYLVSSTVFEGPFDDPADACGETHWWTPLDLINEEEMATTDQGSE